MGKQSLTTRRSSMDDWSSTLERWSRASVVCVLLFNTVEATVPYSEGLILSTVRRRQQQPCKCGAGMDALMDPTWEVYRGQDVVWQIPPNPKAVLFMAHGGDKDSLSFFDQGPKCQRCRGMPEDRAVVLEALRRGYAVIALKSIESVYVDWPLDSLDLEIASSLMKQWTRQHSLESLPLLAWGQSAGGYFITSLSEKLSIRALVLMCSPGKSEVIQNASPRRFPSTFFAYMPVDLGSLDISTKSLHNAAVLRERGVRVASSEIWPLPLSPLFFTQRIPCLTNETSQNIYHAFKAEGWLDSDGYLKKNPGGVFGSDWDAFLRKWKALPISKQSGDLCLVDEVKQELNMAFAFHSLTSAANDEIFPWLDSTLLMRDRSLSTSLTSAVL